MSSVRKKNQGASSQTADIASAFPMSAVTTPTRTGIHTESDTPRHGLVNVYTGITQAQKQALIDNLRLEVTERARKLRAQYALQAQGLRSRLEMRVNRIPQALRKRNIQELLDEHTERLEPAPGPPVPILSKPGEIPEQEPEQHSQKRKSNHISSGEDKENEPVEGAQGLASPKKRAKTVATNAKAARTASRKIAPSNVLSPRAHNSRTLIRSPVKSGLSPRSAQLQRPATSPTKASHLAPPKPSTRAPSRHIKRGTGTADLDRRSSEVSNTSAGTTIATKTEAAKATAASKITKSRTAVKKEHAAPAPAGSGRTLRSKRT